MDYVRHFGLEVKAFETAAREAAGRQAAPAIPSCPGWVMTDLVLHLGMAHRFAARVIGERMLAPPAAPDPPRAELPAGWLPPGEAPKGCRVPARLLDWFHDGAEALEERLLLADPDEKVWSWSADDADHAVGFWRRTEAIEAAVHRWDAQKAVGNPEPLDSALAADAVAQAFELMVPMRRARAQAPPGQGERYLFRRADGPQSWAVRFDGDAVLTGSGDEGQHDIEISGRASDLALFLWHRPVNNQLDITGDTSMLKRYFALVPPA